MDAKIEALAKETYGDSFVKVTGKTRLDTGNYLVMVLYRWMNQETYQEELVTNQCLAVFNEEKPYLLI